MSAPPHSLDAEAAVLGSVLLSERSLSWLLVEERLRPEHFYRFAHGVIFAAMIRLFDHGEPVDAVTVWAEVERTRPALSKRSTDAEVAHAHLKQSEVAILAADVPDVAHARSYARRVVELAELRRKRLAALDILAGVDAEDAQGIADAEGRLVTDRATNASATPEQLAEELFRYVEGGEIEAWPLPWDRLTRLLAGGLKRGEVTLIGGWSSHGKSVLLDQILEVVAKRVRVHLYINEMTRRERGLRTVSRMTGISLLRLSQGKLNEGEHPRFLAAIQGLPHGITDVAGWTAEEIAHDIRRHRWDAAAVDILHLIEHDEERDLARISRALNRAAKLAECHILATVHLSEHRVKQAKRPRPTLGDIRGSGSLKNDADNVLFVFREQSSDGTTVEDEGAVYLAKARNGELGGVPVVFEGRHMRFLAA